MLATLGLLALVAQNPTADLVALGRRLFHDGGLGSTGVACADCHATVRDEASEGDGKLRSGHTAFGMAARPYWRGDTRRTAYPQLGPAIDACVQLFQIAAPLEATDSRALVAYLTSLSPAKGELPIQIQPALEANLIYDRPKYRGGNADRGKKLFYRACHSCHPQGKSGLGPSITGASIPAVVLKIREGNGLLRGARRPSAWMPFFGRDRLSDDEVADIAAYVGTLLPPS